MSDNIARLNQLTQLLNERDLQLEKERKRLRAFNTIISRANNSSTQKELIKHILDACLDIFHFDIGGVYLISGHTARIVASNGMNNDFRFIDTICVENPEYSRIFKEGSPFLIRDYDKKYPKDAALLNNPSVMLFLPIIYNNIIKGCISLASFSPRDDLPSDDCDILSTLSTHLAHVLVRLEVELELIHSKIKLERDRKNFHMLFNKIHDLVFVINDEGNIVIVNDAVVKTLGYSREELIGKPVKMIHDPDECNSAKQGGCSLIIGDTRYCPYVLLSATGKKVFVDTCTTPGLWDGEPVIYAVSRIKGERRD